MDILVFISTGVIAGILAGMLGVGGGLIIVPVLYFSFNEFNIVSQDVMQFALATSLATIVFTSISSTIAHQKRKAIAWSHVKQLSPTIIFGAFTSGWMAYLVDSGFLKFLFAVFLLYVAFKMLKNNPPIIHKNPKPPIITILVGYYIGSISALVGIGGGTLTVPFLHYKGLAFPKAIATSAACGLPISIAASIGYFASNSDITNPLFIGYVYLPALISIALLSVIFAPLGAKLAHSLASETLKKVFALILLFVSFKMFI